MFGICLSGNRPSVCPSVNSFFKDPSVRPIWKTPMHRQHCPLNNCSYFGWVWQILNLRRAGLSTYAWSGWRHEKMSGRHNIGADVWQMLITGGSLQSRMLCSFVRRRKKIGCATFSLNARSTTSTNQPTLPSSSCFSLFHTNLIVIVMTVFNKKSVICVIF